MRNLELREAIREALVQEMRRDETVHLFGEDVAYYGGILGVTKGMLEEFGPERVMDTPISESGFAGMAVGAALMGLRPVIEMQFTGLITVAMDQLVNTGAKARYVHDGAMSVPMVVRSPHMMHGNAYMSQALEAWFTHIPGIQGGHAIHTGGRQGADDNVDTRPGPGALRGARRPLRRHRSRAGGT